MAEKIKSEFIRSWNAYKTYAWGHDVLRPISRSYMDWYEHQGEEGPHGDVLPGGNYEIPVPGFCKS